MHDFEKNEYEFMTSNFSFGKLRNKHKKQCKRIIKVTCRHVFHSMNLKAAYDTEHSFRNV